MKPCTKRVPEQHEAHEGEAARGCAGEGRPGCACVYGIECSRSAREDGASQRCAQRLELRGQILLASHRFLAMPDDSSLADLLVVVEGKNDMRPASTPRVSDAIRTDRLTLHPMRRSAARTRRALAAAKG